MSTACVKSVGIDVSKRELVVAGITSAGMLPPKVFPNTHRGSLSLARFLKAQETTAAVPCVVESTGDFHLLSSLILAEQGFSVKCINPLMTKKYQRSSVRNTKSDSVDALRLADIGMHESALPIFIAEKSIIRAKKMAASCAHLERVAQMLSGHIAQARRTSHQLGFEMDLSETESALRMIKKQIHTLTMKLIAERSERAVRLSKKCKGLTDRKMAVVDAYLRGRTFETRDQLIAFAGLDVMTRRSGAWRGKERISKRGNAYFRKTLYQIAWGLSRYEPTYHAYYLTLRAKKKHFLTCMVAVARKFLRFIFAWYFGSLSVSTTLTA